MGMDMALTPEDGHGGVKVSGKAGLAVVDEDDHGPTEPRRRLALGPVGAAHRRSGASTLLPLPPSSAAAVCTPHPTARGRRPPERERAERGEHVREERVHVERGGRARSATAQGERRGISVLRSVSKWGPRTDPVQGEA